MRASSLFVSLFLLGSLTAVPAGHAQDGGIRIVAIDQLAQAGTARVRAEILDPSANSSIGASPAAGDFAVKLEDGEARLQRIQRVADLNLRTHTVVAIDHSQSFKKWGWADEGWAFAQRVSEQMGPNDTVALQLFSESVESFPSRATAMDFQVDLTQARATPWGRITRLYSSLITAMDGATAENPRGLNRIYLLTDGDEESATYTWEQVADTAKAKGVQVFVVLFPPDMARVSAADRARLPTLLDNLKAIAEATGGEQFEHKAAQPADTMNQVDLWQHRAAQYLAANVRLCGLTRDDADNTTFVDYAPAGTTRQAWSEGFSFKEWGSPELYEPCDPAGAVVDCLPWQEPAPDGLTCAGKSCTTDADCGPGAHCDAGTCAPVATARTGVPSWVWWLIGGLSFLLLLLLVLVAARKNRAEPAQAVVVNPAPAPPASVPKRSPTIAPIPTAKPAEPKMPAGAAASGSVAALPHDLPRTFLVVAEGGAWLKDPRYAVHKRPFQIGGDPGGGNDLVVDQPGVSGGHCCVDIYPRGDVWVRDLESSNGTFVDGARIPRGGKARAWAGSEIRLGPAISFRLEQPDAPVVSRRPADARAPSPSTGWPGQGGRRDSGPGTPLPKAPSPKRKKQVTRIVGAAKDEPGPADPQPARAEGPSTPESRKKKKKMTRIIE